MRYVITCKDRPGNLPVRMENRPAHVEFLNPSSTIGAVDV